MWYVVQTVGGQEKHVLDLINKLVDEEPKLSILSATLTATIQT